LSNQEILEKAIQKAIDGGWEALPINGRKHWIESAPEHRAKDVDMFITMGSKVQSESYRNIIYNHDFAKALWGKEDRQFRSIGGWTQAWKYHLQQMVIAEEPIKYLGENI